LGFAICNGFGLPLATTLDYHYLTRDFENTIACSDAVVVPTRPSFNDVEPFLHTLKMIQTVKPGVPTLVVVNALTPYTISKKLMDWLYAENLDYKIATVARSEAFEQYIGSGQYVVGNDRYGRVSADIRRMNSDFLYFLA
jgi:cellulose biosynthesis protein BcsQ